jgi:hypothetical protein
MGSGANCWVAGDDEEMQGFVPVEDLFKGRHFDRQFIILCVNWYTSFKLSLRDLVGFSATFQNSKNAGGATLGAWEARGRWTRRV